MRIHHIALSIKISALTCAFVYLVGFIIILIVAPDFSESVTIQVKYIEQYPLLFSVWYLLIYIVFSLAMLILNKNLNHLYRPKNEDTTAKTIGDIWISLLLASGFIMLTAIIQHAEFPDSHKEAIWQSIILVHMALGGNIELLGGLWSGLITYQAVISHRLKTHTLYLGWLVALSGISSVIPPLQFLGIFFGLLQLCWFLSLAFDTAIKR